MELKILWMYPDIMDLYGDAGNIQILKGRCETRGIKCSVKTCSINEDINFSEYDLLFIGGGADNEQQLIFKDLLQRKDDIKKAIDNDMFVLLICGGYQLFGKYYLDSNGNKIEGLNFYDYYTTNSIDKYRCTGNIAIEPMIEGLSSIIVGFENHGGQTQNVEKPFGKVIKGNGNVSNGSHEGFFDKNVLGTYLHGPLLSKNPELADFIIKKSLLRRHDDVNLSKLDDTFELKANEVILNKLNIL